MIKLIVLLAAAIPVVLFLRTLLFGRSKVMQGAMSDFRKHIDYLVWAILILIGCALVYTLGMMIYGMVHPPDVIVPR